MKVVKLLNLDELENLIETTQRTKIFQNNQELMEEVLKKWKAVFGFISEN